MNLIRVGPVATWVVTLAIADSAFGAMYKASLLHPAGFEFSSGIGISGGSQVGTGTPSGASDGHALLWSGTAESVVDLHPDGFKFSEADAVSGLRQAGYGYGPSTGGNPHALTWSGTAESVVDLHSYLGPLGLEFTYSLAHGISEDGTIIGYAGVGNTAYAVLWTPIPEPTTAALFACGVVVAALVPTRRVPPAST